MTSTTLKFNATEWNLRHTNLFSKAKTLNNTNYEKLTNLTRDLDLNKIKTLSDNESIINKLNKTNFFNFSGNTSQINEQIEIIDSKIDILYNNSVYYSEYMLAIEGKITVVSDKLDDVKDISNSTQITMMGISKKLFSDSNSTNPADPAETTDNNSSSTNPAKTTDDNSSEPKPCESLLPKFKTAIAQYQLTPEFKQSLFTQIHCEPTDKKWHFEYKDKGLGDLVINTLDLCNEYLGPVESYQPKASGLCNKLFDDSTD